MLLALLLGAILGSVPLFRESVMVGTKLRASHLAQFLGYGGALMFLWLLTHRAAQQIPSTGERMAFLHHIITPLVTLIVLSAGYPVLLILLDPFLAKPVRTIYNWIFVSGIVSVAVWLTIVLFRNSSFLVDPSTAEEERGSSKLGNTSFFSKTR
jgi:hypothetical protein